jgi:hypothetical protein
MWKLLRNLALVALLLAGAAKLLAWYSVGQEAERLTAALAPAVEVKYEGLSAGLDGSVSLTGVSVAHTATHRVYRADSLSFETPGLLWLLKHSLLHENTPPPQLAVTAQGLRLPPVAWLDPEWFDPSTFVPFAVAGCGIKTFAPADLRKMGAPEPNSRERIEYRYEADAHALTVGLSLSAPGYATLTLKTEMRPFDPAAATDGWEKVHVQQINADYTDDGFLRQRNHFCAQRANIGPLQFIDTHVAAVQAMLGQHRIEPSNELVQLYKNLMQNGGQASVLSLPNPGFAVGSLRGGASEELLRQLNITTRYGDKPPIMFRLSFAPPPPEEQAAADEAAATTAAPATTAAAGPEVAAAVPLAPEKTLTGAPPVAVAAPPPTKSTPVPAPGPAPPPEIQKPASAPVTEAAVVAKPPPAATPDRTTDPVAKRPNDNLGLHDLDRAEAKLAPPPPAKSRKTSDATTSEFASAPPPPPDSTLALVWKPTIERLAPPPPQERDYDVIEFAGLKNLPGHRVRLITDGGKHVEGYVISADDALVRLRIRHPDGDFTFEVPKGRITQVQLLKNWAPLG